MKAFLFLLAISVTMHVAAQTKETYGMFRKSDGSRIKGTVKLKGFEDQISISNYTGGSDNSGAIEIEVPSGIYVAEFRNLMNTVSNGSKVIAASPKTIAEPATIRKDAGVRPSPTMQMEPAKPRLARAEISVTENNPPQYLHRTVSQIVLEDLIIESCTDNATTGTTRIKLKGSRIGWVYYSFDSKGNRRSNQSGWNTVTGQQWNNF
ncbi:hypothetical protein HHL16_23965 [Pseudoflavitalea sp. G-6-1-2]|uniref:hypothetical protein n=1 Tax=Pseudoflavitalea sp. G-6-1-2 TaxID=2728841 RepID=UPI001469AE88|nr:hypothetical protein [Pseudoflavitalea sp. G-6-1-2]NML23959.1 hypothetical protein [Pseudoflavitalea sp. G-6-1-2]